MFAKSTIAGNLTADPELKHVGTNNTALVKFTIAVNDRFGDNDEAYFFNVQAWGGRAEAIAEHFRKGDRISVTCDMRQERWEDKSTGQKRSKDVHNVTGIMFNSKGKNERAAGKSKGFAAEYGKQGSKQSEPMTTHQLAERLPLDYGDDDDIPF